MKFDERPFLAIWETTQACDLACRHCRASAQPSRDCGELTTSEGKQLLDDFARAKVPLVVLTGGDPAKRPDLLELIEYGIKRGLTMALTPSATPLVTDELVRELARLKLSCLAISIDGPEADTHDTFRGVSGSFSHSQRILAVARASGLATQINTSIHTGNISQLDAMSALVATTGARLWSVFYVVPTGRAQADMMPSADAVERSLEELATLAENTRFAIKTTAAPHYRRVLAERAKARGSSAEHGFRGKPAVRINDGRGFLFVSHRGEIFPSGFLPVHCGNVRTESAIEVYRNHPTFQGLRSSEEFKGKCGACDYRNLCGGSRARAYALTGDLLGSDPLCAYVPPGFVDTSEGRSVRRRLEVC